VTRNAPDGTGRARRWRRNLPWAFVAVAVAAVAVGAVSRQQSSSPSPSAVTAVRAAPVPPARQVSTTDPAGGSPSTSGAPGTTVAGEPARAAVPGVPVDEADPGPTGPPAIRVVAQDPWIGPRGVFRLQVRAVTPETGYVLDARLYRAVPTAETVLSTGPDALPARSLGLLTEIDLPAGSTTHRVEVPVVPEADGTFGDPYVLDPGVFPVRVRLLDPTGRTVSTLVTHLVHLPPSLVTEPAAVGLLTDLRSGPVDGDGAGGAGDAARPPSLLARQLDDLSAYGNLPMSLAMHPETVAGLTATRTGAGGPALSDLLQIAGSGSTGRAEVVRSTFVGFDEAAWLADQHPDLVQGELDLASTTLASAGLRVPRATVALQGRPDVALLAQLATQGIDRVVAPGPERDGRAVHLGRGPGPVPQQPAQLVLPAPALAVTPGAAVDGRPDGLDVLDAHRVLAALLVAPIEGDRSAQQLRLGAGADLGGPFGTELFGALARNGPLRAVTITELFDDARAGSPPPVDPVADTTPRGRSQPRSDRLTATSVRVEGVRSLLGDDDLATVLSLRLLLVPSSNLSETAADSLLAEVDAALAAVTGDIVLPATQAFTTTSHETSIPLVIRNESSQVLRVGLHLTSGELEFRGPNPRMIELRPGPNDLEIPIKTRRSGEFDFRVRVLSPDENLTVGDIEVRVQSRAISGVGLFLSSGALAYLLVWWFRNTRRRRTTAKAGTPTGTPQGDRAGTHGPAGDDQLSPVGADRAQPGPVTDRADPS
jgi:hypothetical protein